LPISYGTAWNYVQRYKDAPDDGGALSKE